MSLVKEIVGNIKEVSAEVQAEDLETSSGSTFINECGVYPVTIKEAFLTATAKGGLQLDLHFSGNEFMTRLFPVSKRNGELVTTYVSKGKTHSLADFKLLKQLLFVTTGKVMNIPDITTKEETIKFKEYGKDKAVDGETIVELKGKEINIGVRLEEKYAWDASAEEEDKTQLKTNDNGDVVYDKKLFSIYAKSGKTPTEIVKKEEPTQIEKDKTFLKSAKGIRRVKLEKAEPEYEVSVEGFDDNSGDQLDF